MSKLLEVKWKEERRNSKPSRLFGLSRISCSFISRPAFFIVVF